MATRKRGPDVYRRRIDRLLAKGLSRSAARGHGKGGEPTAGRKPAKPDARLAEGFALVASGQSVTATAKELRISTERLRRALAEKGDYLRQGRRHVFVPRVTNDFPMYSKGESIRVLVDDENAVRLGAYMAAVGKFWSTNQARHLAPFVGDGLSDVRGRAHPFETDPEELYALRAKGRPVFHQIYRNPN